MIYRNKKRIAAVWVLKQLCNQPSITQQHQGDVILNEKITSGFSYQELQKLIDKNKFSKEILLETAYLLLSKKHIEILRNDNNIYEISLKGTEEGQFALNDDYYQDEIAQYKNDKIYSTVRWVMPVIAFLFAIITTGYSTCMNIGYSKQIETLKNEVGRLSHEQKFNTLKYR